MRSIATTVADYREQPFGIGGLVRTMSYQVSDHIRDVRLTAVLEAYEPNPLPVQLVYRQQSRLPLKLRSFLDFAMPRLRARLDAVAV